MRKLLSLFLIGTLALGLTACGGIDFDEETMVIVQKEEPFDGQDMAVFTTNYGEIKAVLYTERCPNTVENFITLANEGYYNDQVVFGIEPEVYFLAGSPAEDGKDATTITEKAIQNEYHQDLWPFTGALCSIGEKEGYADSRYFFCGSVDIDEQLVSDMTQNMYPQKAIDAFVELGGVPGIAMSYTVFGQTIEGFEVIEEILNVQNKGDEQKTPEETIIIEKVEIVNYNAN